MASDLPTCDLKVASAQFENKDGDKAYNLSVIDKLSGRAAAQGVQVIVFHELCVTAYTYLKDLTLEQLNEVSEPVPGPSTNALQAIAKKHNITVCAGVVERDPATGNIYNTFVCVDGDKGVLGSHRKIHPFIHPAMVGGDHYTVFDLHGWKAGILICYDNNVVENVRATALLGAQIILAPHVTMCTPSPMPGRGFVDPALWVNRERDPVALRLEFDGPKGMRWLYRWLPACAYQNGVYYVFSNPIGMDGDQLKNGNPLVLDPFGETLSELKSFEDGFTVATCIPEKLTRAGGYRYRQARKPELYGHIIGAPHNSVTKPVWLAKK